MIPESGSHAMDTTPAETKAQADPVVAAEAARDRAAGRLVCLRKDDAPEARVRALAGLLRLGPWATAQVLIREMGRCPEDAVLRGRIVGALGAVGHDPTARGPAMGALFELLRRE